MKLKLTMLTLVAAFGAAMSSNAAVMIVSNLAVGPGDTLWANKDGTLLNGGSVSLGYFPAGVNPTDLTTLVANLGQFQMVTSVAGGFAENLGGAGNPGYAEQANPTTVPGSPIIVGNALIGRSVYMIATDALSVASATGTSQFGLFNLGVFVGDDATEQSFVGDPKGRVPIIGTVGTFTGETLAGTGTYGTLQMDVIPEPSAALLGALGALGLLRRRRN